MVMIDLTTNVYSKATGFYLYDNYTTYEVMTKGEAL